MNNSKIWVGSSFNTYFNWTLWSRLCTYTRKGRERAWLFEIYKDLIIFLIVDLKNLACITLNKEMNRFWVNSKCQISCSLIYAHMQEDKTNRNRIFKYSTSNFMIIRSDLENLKCIKCHSYRVITELTTDKKTLKINTTFTKAER